MVQLSKTQEAMNRLKASRAGESRARQYQKETANKDNLVYDEVDEGVYQKIVHQRLLRDDFIENDQDLGYDDNGEDDGFHDSSENDFEEEKEEVRKVRTSGPKMPLAQAKARRPRPLQTDVPEAGPSHYRKPIAASKEAEFMDSILGGLDVELASSKKRKNQSGTFGTNSNRPISSMQPVPRISPSGNSSPELDDRGFDTPVKKVKLESDASSDDDGKDSSYSDLDFENLQFDEDDLPEDIKQLPIIPDANSTSSAQTGPSSIKVSDDVLPIDLDSKMPSWLEMNRVANDKVVDSAEFDALGPLESTESTTAPRLSDFTAPDESLHFFWLDYLELDGKIYLTGKVREMPATSTDGERSKASWVSCCVTIRGMQRNVFLKPRQFKLDSFGNETDDVPTEDDVNADFDQIRKEHGIKSWMSKQVSRKYVFDTCESQASGAQEYVKVLYGFNEPQLPNNIRTRCIETCLGTNTSAFELFVLKRKIMGPCWLTINKPEISSKKVSWCQIEVEVSDPKCVIPVQEDEAGSARPLPPLKILSISLRTVVNHVTNQREIIAASARFWEDVSLDDLTPPEKLPHSIHTYVRCLDKFPADFEKRAKSSSPLIQAVKTEKALLSSLLAIFRRTDPDVLVGHEFLGVYLDVLLHRLKQLKVDPWSCIGRFRRTKWPLIGKQGSNIKFVQGRLVCDLASDCAKSMITSTTWSMTEMCSSQLGMARQEIDPEETPLYFDSTVTSPDRLLSFVRHCELDAFLQMALSTKVQMLPLTKQLTGLAGNSWNKTLNGGRAERNEYILLHEFHRLKYICPDKTWGKKAAAVAVKAEADDLEAADGVAVPSKAKRDKYQGGLVFEPKRGLWDKYILVMDFNSLYPSIIQEYNIDFTTVPSNQADDETEIIPDVPAPDLPLGVLPRLIATLVNRRKQVKGLMKDPKATPSQMMQWDIKQKALKLTANSMYGCLGFEHSRFYARPLAALTTFKGREILMQTKELAESLQLDVVYGDTDSVFVNSNADSFPDALKVASIFKKQVNERYKLLEIDLDAVFKRLLLLQKKKYAALKMEGPAATSIEIKGLDMKRREFCALSKEVSKKILDFILSGRPTEDVVQSIHEYLQNVGEDVKTGNCPVEDFIIFKRLGKNPEDYGSQTLPHVQVALRMKARGGSAKVGDVIPYIFCLGADGQTAKSGQADKAMHPDEVRRGGDTVKIDLDFYLSQQILPPVERLCEPIEGTDRSRIAECLGLDAARFTTLQPTSERLEYSMLQTLIPDKERFKDVESLAIGCKACSVEFPFPPIQVEASIGQSHACPHCACTISVESVENSIHIQIRRCITKYYEGWMVCTEPTCQSRSRSVSVWSRRCVQPGCHGTLAFEYSNKQLYNQLLYMQMLIETKIKSCFVSKSDITGLQSMVELIKGYLEKCARGWVPLQNIFMFSAVSY